MSIIEVITKVIFSILKGKKDKDKKRRRIKRIGKNLIVNYIKNILLQ